MKHRSLRYLTEAGLIAAAYAAATYLCSLFGLAYGPMQLRLSEALCILPVLFPSAVPGLTVGCLIGNLGSTLGPVDLILGTAATLLGAVLTRLTRRVTLKGLPLLSALFPALTNGLIVGAEITLFLGDAAFSWKAYLLNACWIAAGELLILLLLGLPLWSLLRKTDKENTWTNP